MVGLGPGNADEGTEALLKQIQREELVGTPDASDLPVIGLPVHPEAADAPGSVDSLRGELMRNVRMRVKVELGRTRMPLREALKLSSGSIIELGKEAGDPVEILVNELPIARGQILVVDDRYCVRITEILATGGKGEER